MRPTPISTCTDPLFHYTKHFRSDLRGPMGLQRHHGRVIFAVSRRITSPAPAGRVAPDMWGAAAPASDLRRGAAPWWRGMGASLAFRPGQRERVVSPLVVTVPS